MLGEKQVAVQKNDTARGEPGPDGIGMVLHLERAF